MNRYIEKKSDARAKAKERGQVYRAYIRSEDAGFEIALAPVAGIAFGALIDRSFGSAPLGLLVGTFLGFGLMIKRIIEISAPYRKASKEAEMTDEVKQDSDD